MYSEFSFPLFLIFFNGTAGTSVSVINDCGFTVWPEISGNPALNITGFELTEGSKHTLHTPEEWQGKIWGRTGCTFNGSGHGYCKTGDCDTGKIECNGRSATPPVTLSQFDFGKFKDYYDVSLISGYNLQMTVEASDGLSLYLHDCSKTGCVDDLSQRCPTELRLESGGGCMSTCQAFGTQDYCCNSTFPTSDPCKSTTYTPLFRSACPRSYGHGVYHTGFLDSPYICGGANYTVRFCPPADTFSTIKVGSQLNYYDQLLSIRGNFTLGFYDSIDGREGVFNDDGNYLGNWYTSDNEVRKVWVANPNKPIISTTAATIALSIDANTGNLIITSGGTTLMNITDVQAGPNPNVTATLEDTGNFRLINEIDKRVLWQSFDHPTNVLLPGMKLGFNKTTGQNWTLTSWSSNELLSLGAFTLSVESNYEGVQTLMIRRRGQPYWRKSLYDQISFEDLFASSNHPGRQPYYTLTCVNSMEGWYFKYESSYIEFPMWILTPEGRITDDDNYVWSPEFCYGYYSGDGCVEFSLPQCMNLTFVDDTFDEKKREV